MHSSLDERYPTFNVYIVRSITCIHPWYRDLVQIEEGDRRVQFVDDQTLPYNVVGLSTYLLMSWVRDVLMVKAVLSL